MLVDGDVVEIGDRYDFYICIVYILLREMGKSINKLNNYKLRLNVVGYRMRKWKFRVVK